MNAVCSVQKNIADILTGCLHPTCQSLLLGPILQPHTLIHSPLHYYLYLSLSLATTPSAVHQMPSNFPSFPHHLAARTICIPIPTSLISPSVPWPTVATPHLQFLLSTATHQIYKFTSFFSLPDCMLCYFVLHVLALLHLYL